MKSKILTTLPYNDFYAPENFQILAENLIYDLINSGTFKLNKTTSHYEMCIQKHTIKTIIGKCFESRILQLINNNNESKKALFLKSTGNSRVSQKHLDKFTLVGTGLIETKNKFPDIYNPNSSKDFVFLRPAKKNKTFNKSNLIEDTELSPVQLKTALSHFYLYHTLNHMISGRYNGLLLTSLKLESGEHSKDFLIRRIKELKQERKITIYGKKHSLNEDLRNKIINNIISPEDLCISQNLIDEYYQFVNCWLHSESGLQNDPLFKNIIFACSQTIGLINNNKYCLGFEFKEKYRDFLY